jgi:hypothetical protein
VDVGCVDVGCTGCVLRLDMFCVMCCCGLMQYDAV